MKRIAITGMLIIFSILFCGAQSIKEAAEAQKQREAQQQQAAEAQRQTAEAQKRQEEALKKQAQEAQIKEQARLREMQLTIDQIFQIVNTGNLESISAFLTSRGWECHSRETKKEEKLPEADVTDWRPPSGNKSEIFVHYMGSFDNVVAFCTTFDDHFRQLEKDIKAKEFQEVPSERSLLLTGVDKVDKCYRNSQYEVGFINRDNLVYAYNYKDIEFYREEVARLEREAFERANQPAVLYIYRKRKPLDLLPKRYEIYLDNTIVGNSTNNWKTTATVTPPLGTKTVSATIDGRKAEVQITFEPGGVYYVRSDVDSKNVDTGKTKTTTDKNGKTTTTAVKELQYTPILQSVGKNVGESEFNAIVVK